MSGRCRAASSSSGVKSVPPPPSKRMSRRLDRPGSKRSTLAHLSSPITSTSAASRRRVIASISRAKRCISASSIEPDTSTISTSCGTRLLGLKPGSQGMRRCAPARPWLARYERDGRDHDRLRLRRQRARQLRAQHLLPRRAAARQVGEQRAQHRVLAVAGVRALQPLAPFARGLGLVFGRLCRRPRPRPPGRAGRARPARARAARWGRRRACAASRRAPSRTRRGCPAVRRCRVRRGRRWRGTAARRPTASSALSTSRFSRSALRQQLLQAHRARRQLQPAQVAERAVDDGVGADVEELRVDVAQQLLQLALALRVAQRDVQHLVRDPARLLGQRQGLEGGAVADAAAVGGHRRARRRRRSRGARPTAPGRRWTARTPPSAGWRACRGACSSARPAVQRTALRCM